MTKCISGHKDEDGQLYFVFYNRLLEVNRVNKKNVLNTLKPCIWISIYLNKNHDIMASTK